MKYEVPWIECDDATTCGVRWISRAHTLVICIFVLLTFIVGHVSGQALPAQETRTGAVRLDGRAFADDGGTWNPLGASLFWALWGERHDPERLDRNLAHLAAHNVDYVRILAMVGTESWKDRAIDPHAADYWETVDRLFDRLERHGLRVHVTLFADAQVIMPDPKARERFVDAWAARSRTHRQRIFVLEVANEYWQNGFEGQPGTRQLRVLAERLASATAVPVAISSVPDGPGEWCRVYAGVLGVDAATIHYDRATDGAEGPWWPVRQPWGYPSRYESGCEGQLPTTAISNEPIGPFSSVVADADPLRLALAYVTTFVAGNAAYVFHSGPGVRGGGAADAVLGRPANVYDLDIAILGALATMRRRMPAGLANWERHNAQWTSMPWDGSQRGVDRGDLVRAYAATSGDKLVGVLLGVRRPHEIVARRAMRLTLIHPATGATITRVSLDVGASWTVPAALPGYVILGEL